VAKCVSYKEAIKRLTDLGFRVIRDDLNKWRKAGHISKDCRGIGGKLGFNFDQLVKHCRMLNRENKKPSVDPSKLPTDKKGIEQYVIDLLGDPASLDIATTTIFKNLYDGLIKKQKHDIEAEKYVLKSEVENAAFKTARIMREHMGALPERWAGQLAAMDDAHEIKELLYDEISKLLTDLADGNKLK